MAIGIRTVLVAIAEPRAAAQPLLTRALAIAKNTGARLVLFHASFETSLNDDHGFDAAQIDRLRQDLLTLRLAEVEKLAAKLRRQGAKVEVLCSWDEPPHEAIVRAALATKASLVIAGPHAQSGPRSPWRLRHTDWQLLRLCPVPLLLVRARRRARGVVLTALDPTHTSDSKLSFDKALVRAANTVAEALRFELHAVHCIVPGQALLGESLEALHRRVAGDVTAQLRRVLAAARVRARGVHLLDGLPDVEIPASVQRFGADILAIGTVSRRGLAKYVFGNTAERIVDAVDADLLIVKPPGLRLPSMSTKPARLQLRSKGTATIRKKNAR